MQLGSGAQTSVIWSRLSFCTIAIIHSRAPRAVARSVSVPKAKQSTLATV